jgi:hypothetical protein
MRRRSFFWVAVFVVLGLFMSSQAVLTWAGGRDLPVPVGVRTAVELKNSLTDAQKAAIAEVLGKYLAEFQAIQAALPSVGSFDSLKALGSKPALPSEAQLSEDKAKLQTMTKALVELEDVQAKVEQDLQKILTTEQWAKYQAAGPGKSKVGSAKALVSKMSAANPSSNGYAADIVSSNGYCFAAGIYAAISDLYAWYGYLFAYYNYVYNTYGSYNGYYYASYMTDNAYEGLELIGAGFFYLQEWYDDVWDFIYDAYTYFDDAYYYAYYAGTYEYNNYSAYGYSYAYYAYLYTYYAYYYLYYADAYAYYAYLAL